MQNLKYEQFKVNLKSVILSSGLDVGAAYYIAKDVFGELERTYNGALQEELAEMQKTFENKAEKSEQSVEQEEKENVGENR